MTVEQLKAVATAKYESQGRYEVIYTNLFSDFLNQYDRLVGQGYRKPDDQSIEVTNINLGSCQVVYMLKPEKVQKAELKAILAEIESQHN